MKQQNTIVVALIRNKEGQLLLSHRIDPKFPAADDKWELVGGKIEFGETPEQAIIREAKEESGLDIAVTRLLPFLPTHYWKDKEGNESQVFVLNFECHIVGGSLHQNGLAGKISELKFVDLADVDSYDTMPNVKEAARLLAA